MTQAKKIPNPTEHAPLSHCFLPLFLCFAMGTAAAFFPGDAICADTYTVTHSIPHDSLTDGLFALVRYLRGTVWQTTAVFLSAFALFPSMISVPIVLWRGLCMGHTLYAVQAGHITGTASPEGHVVLYFAGTVLLLLMASMAEVCHGALRSVPLKKTGRHALFFAYIRAALVAAGGIFALSALAVLFC